MRKVLAALTFTLLLIVPTIFIQGCGKKESGSAKLREIIDQSNKTMQQVKTFKMDFNSIVDAPALRKQKEKLSVTASADISDKSNLKYQIQFSGIGTSTEAYSIDNYVYANVPDKGWMKSPAAEVHGMMDIFQLSPAELNKLTDNARELKMRSETDNDYVISFKVGPEFFEKAILEQQVIENLEPETKYMIKEMSKHTNIRAVFTIDKETMRVTKVGLVMDVKDLELVGDINMKINAEFLKYDEPVEIVLPPEAVNAREANPEEIRKLLEQLPI